MRAMILAAGRGQRMMPLTAKTAKPLLNIQQKPIIDYHLEKLAAAGFSDVVVNLGWCGHQIKDYLKSGRQYGVNIHYSEEPEQALETAGGILQALPQLSEQFLVINGDIFTDYDVSSLCQIHLDTARQGHLVLVENPQHNLQGDFALSQGNLLLEGESKYTFAGIALYHKSFFADLTPGRRALAPIFKDKIAQQQLSAELYLGRWHDVGTPQRLADLNEAAEV